MRQKKGPSPQKISFLAIYQTILKIFKQKQHYLLAPDASFHTIFDVIFFTFTVFEILNGKSSPISLKFSTSTVEGGGVQILKKSKIDHPYPVCMLYLGFGTGIVLTFTQWAGNQPFKWKT